MEIVTITPTLASEWLDKSAEFNNRNVRRNVVDKYVRDMQAGNWQFNGETIKIDTLGRVIDGQHRLHAVIQANVPIKTIVVHDLPTEAASTIDHGAPRRFADTLKMGGATNSGMVAAALLVWKITNGRLLRSSSASDSELSEVLENFPWIQEIPIQDIRRIGRLTGGPSVALGCFSMFFEIDPDLADGYFKRLATGLGLTEDDPVYVMRRAFENAAIGQYRPIRHWHPAMLIKCWNYLHAGATPKKFGWGTSEAFPEIRGRCW